MTVPGVILNKQMFGSLKPTSTQSVDGYGQSAYWDMQAHQLNILQVNNWIIITVSGTNPENNTLEEAKKVADTLRY